MNRTPLILAIVLLLLPILYVGSYLALVVPGRFAEPPGPEFSTTIVEPDHYRFEIDGWARLIFWPLEQIDRRVRPRAWEQSFATPFSPEILQTRTPPGAD